MSTHIIYSQNKKKRAYFCGKYTGNLNPDGFVNIEWHWSYSKEDALVLCTTDAWDLLFMARSTWPQAKIEVERIVEWPK